LAFDDIELKNKGDQAATDPAAGHSATGEIRGHIVERLDENDAQSTTGALVEVENPLEVDLGNQEMEEQAQAEAAQLAARRARRLKRHKERRSGWTGDEFIHFTPHIDSQPPVNVKEELAAARVTIEQQRHQLKQIMNLAKESVQGKK
jgi:hypothetical protein